MSFMIRLLSPLTVFPSEHDQVLIKTVPQHIEPTEKQNQMNRGIWLKMCRTVGIVLSKGQSKHRIG